MEIVISARAWNLHAETTIKKIRAARDKIIWATSTVFVWIIKPLVLGMLVEKVVQ
jgi:hypothetical protein